MRKKSNTDVIEMVTRFQKRILDNKPSSDQMYQEIRMMKFKIKPVIGDISYLNLKNNNFIEILWSLGKIDEFFQKQVEDLSTDEKEVFYKLLDEIYERYQDDLNMIDLKTQDIAPPTQGFEMEIFKEKPQKVN
jgi:hypothetical protein